MDINLIHSKLQGEFFRLKVDHFFGLNGKALRVESTGDYLVVEDDDKETIIDDSISCLSEIQSLPYPTDLSQIWQVLEKY